MGRETVVLVLMAVLVGMGVVRLVRLTQAEGAPGPRRQVAFGLGCGALGAVVAAVPYADVVPDVLEVPLLVVVPLAIAGALGRGLWTHRRPRARRARVWWRPRKQLVVDPSAVSYTHLTLPTICSV